jgi:hypothetical protein
MVVEILGVPLDLRAKSMYGPGRATPGSEGMASL